MTVEREKSMFFLLLMLLEISFSQRKTRTRLNTVVHGRNGGRNGLDDVYIGTEEYIDDTSKEEFYDDCDEQIYDCDSEDTTTPPGNGR